MITIIKRQHRFCSVWTLCVSVQLHEEEKKKSRKKSMNKKTQMKERKPEWKKQSERSVRGEALTGLSLSDTRCDWISMKWNTWENDTEWNEPKEPPHPQQPHTHHYKNKIKEEARGLSRKRGKQKQVIELKERKSLICSDSDEQL